MSKNNAEKKNKGFVEDLVDSIKSCSPLTYIVTTDEAATMRDIQRAVASFNLHLKNEGIERSIAYFEWNCIDGLSQGQMQQIADDKLHYTNYVNGKKEKENFAMLPKADVQNSKELVIALDHFSPKQPKNKTEQQISAQVVVLKDPHTNLRDVKAIRKIKNLVMSNSDDDCLVGKCIIIVSAVKHIPVELNNLINVIEWRLPDADDVVNFLKTGEYITDIVEDGVKIKTVKNSIREQYAKGEIAAIQKALSGLSFPEIDNIVAMSNSRFSEIVPSFLMEQKKQMIIKNGMLEYFDPKIGMSDIGGMDCLKDWIKIRKKAFSDEAHAFGIDPPKGVVLVGIQGCGKSHMAKAIAGLLGLPLLRFDVGKVFSKTVGSSEENIRGIISLVEAVAPCVLMIDEIEKGLAGIQSSNQSDGGTTARVVGTLLSWLNDKTSPVFVVATANNIKQLPPELQRKGRFDEIFFVALPEAPEREEIFKIHLTKRGRDPEKFNCSAFAELSDKFSGAECEEAIKSGLIIAFDKNQELADNHIIEAIHDLIPLWKTCQEDLEYLYEWVGWDEKKQDGIRARFSSTARKKVSEKQNGNVIQFGKK